MSDPYDDDDDGEKPEDPKKPPYEVGYGKPPLHSRFKPKESGNPRGRPKGSLGLKTDLSAMLAEKVQITENGKSRTLTMQQLMLKSLGVQVTKGKVAAIKEMRELILLLIGDGSEKEAKPSLNAAERAMMERFFSSFDTEAIVEEPPSYSDGEGAADASPPPEPPSNDKEADDNA